MVSPVELKLLSDVIHEVFCVRGVAEVLVAAIGNRKHLSWGLNLLNVRISVGCIADFVPSTDEEGHWHRVDFAYVDSSAVVIASCPLIHSHWLFELVVHAKLRP